MIARYTKPEMGKIWTSENRFEMMKLVELAVAQAQAKMGIIPEKAAKNIVKKAKVNVPRIEEIEKETRHDVIAFVSQLAESVGSDGKFIHYGLTSSDVLDTALSLSIKESEKLLMKQWKDIDKTWKSLIRKNAKNLCAGRTHGMHGEPTSFGFKLCGFHAEYRRNIERIRSAFSENLICKLSGAVGTYNSLPQTMEKKVAKSLGLKSETIATQVVPRDRHSVLLNSFAVYASGIERFAVELRHLQRTEVSEVFEGFSKGQKGSSAMPHKKNPITAENLTGLARMLRAYAQTGLENISLWHERDLSHSSTERVFFADAFVLIHYMNFRLLNLLEGLQVDKKRMLKNLELSQGSVYSSQILLALVQKGMSREEAYKKVQSLSHSMQAGETLKEKCLEDTDIVKLMGKDKIQSVFTGKALQEKLSKQIDSYLKEQKRI